MSQKTGNPPIMASAARRFAVLYPHLLRGALPRCIIVEKKRYAGANQKVQAPTSNWQTGALFETELDWRLRCRPLPK